MGFDTSWQMIRGIGRSSAMDGDEGRSINRGTLDKTKEAQGGNEGRG